MNVWDEYEVSGHRIRQASPRTPKELADLVRTSEVVITMDHSSGDWRIPTRAQSVWLSFDSMIEAYEEHSGKDCDYVSYLKTQKAYIDSQREKEREPKLNITAVYFDQLGTPLKWDDLNQVVTLGRINDHDLGWLELASDRKCVVPHSDLVGPYAWARASGENPVDSMLLNSPNVYESRYGNWSDWVLEVKAVTAAGDLVKFGSKVVKNVAGFDLARFTVGSRGTLCIPYEVTFRTTPLLDAGISDAVYVREPWEFETANWKQRVPVGDLAEAVRLGGDAIIAVCPVTGQLWARTDEPLKRFPHDSVMRSGAFAHCIEVSDPQTQALMRRTKQLFDPTNKLNPGEFGFL